MNVTVHSSGNGSTPVEITIYEPRSTDVKATSSGSANSAFQFTVDSPDLWSPGSPTLYNISVKLGDDTIQSYTGFRTVSRGEIDGVERPLLNGEFVFQFGTLDQGYWPDGLHTPPSREAMIYDVQALKEVGYNMLRKHVWKCTHPCRIHADFPSRSKLSRPCSTRHATSSVLWSSRICHRWRLLLLIPTAEHAQGESQS